MTWYLGLDLGATGMAAALLHRQTQAVYPLTMPGGECVAVNRSTSRDEPGIDWAWMQRGLKMGIPGDGSRSPQLRYAQDHGVPLSTLRQRLTQQLLQIQAMKAPLLPLPLSTVLQDLRGVVLAVPSDGSDCYCFNLREAVLGANLVASPDQIFFVETAIAAFLSGRRSLPPSKTLVIHTNPATTELGLIDRSLGAVGLDAMPRHCLSFAYGDRAMAQDILCQMFYGALSHPELGLSALPLPGQPDVVVRDRFQQQLQSTALGRRLGQTADALRGAFQQPLALDFQVNGESRTVRPEDFDQAVLEPYLRRLHPEINRLMAQAGWRLEAIAQVICSGEMATMGAIAQWLQQKFPAATQICLAPDMAEAAIAAGLARLPLYPQLVNAQQHQYSNLFLMKELLTALPKTPLSWVSILKVLEQRGINTVLCQRAILRLLEGDLPEGLVCVPEDVALITDGGAVLEAPWFVKVETQYQMNPAVRDRLQAHLTAILTQTHQTLADPLTLASLLG